MASTGLDETIRWWDLATGKEIRKVAWRAAPATLVSVPVRLVFTPDGKTLVSAGGGSIIRLWDVATGEQRRGPEGHEGGVDTVAVSPDGRTLASCSSNDHTVRLWDATTGRPHHVLRHPAYVRRVLFSPDGERVVSACGDGVIRLWSAATGEEVRAMRLAEPARDRDPEQIINLGLTAGGKQVVSLSVGLDPKVAGRGHRLVTWDVATGKRLSEREGTDDLLSALSADGTLLAELTGAGVVVRRVATGNVAVRIGVPAGAVGFWYPMVFSPSRKLLATVTFKLVADGKGRRPVHTVRVWELASGKELWSSPTTRWGRAMAFSPNGSRLAWAGADVFAVHDAATGKELLRREGFDGSVLSLAFSPGGTRLATGLDNATMLVWDVSRAAADPGR
jgi:WD40 repeat protein